MEEEDDGVHYIRYIYIYIYICLSVSQHLLLIYVLEGQNLFHIDAEGTPVRELEPCASK